MMRKLLKLVLLAAVLFLGLKVFVAVNAHIMLSGMKDKFKNDFLLTYGWISSDLSGSVTIEDIEFTPYALKKTFKIDQITLEYPDLSVLLSDLSHLSQLSLRGLKSISVPSIKSELKGITLRERLKVSYGSNWLALADIYACDHAEGPDSKRFSQLGIDSWQASLTIKLESGVDNQIHIDFDQQEFGRYQVDLLIPSHKLDAFLKSGSPADLGIKTLELVHQDAGLFRRLNVLCNQSQEKDRSLYSAQAALAWKNAMLAQGLRINDEMLKLYARYLMQGGTFSLSLTQDQVLDVNQLKKLIDKDLISELNVSMALNDEPVKGGRILVDSAILYPPAKPIISSAQDKPAFEPGFYAFDLTTLSQHIEKKVRVTMLSDKVYEGVLTQFTEYNLELSQNLPGGVVNYPLMLNDIKRFEVWLNSRL